MEHGWVVRAGVIIDPTLPEEVVAYCPGLEFKGRGGIAAFLQTPRGRRCKRSPFFYAFGWRGCGSKSFIEAHRRCAEFVTTLVAREKQE